MPIVKLNCINKAGKFLINSGIAYIESETKAATVHLTDGLLVSVGAKIEDLAPPASPTAFWKAVWPRTATEVEA